MLDTLPCVAELMACREYNADCFHEELAERGETAFIVAKSNLQNPDPARWHALPTTL